ncbi:MAG TPA: nuclear transport factor 2 family protein [Acidimicrobiales bacterium]|nr:nuclear transport factor 2 family protein [Acidimicrobiales bacterium]
MFDGTDIILIHQLLARYGHALDARDWESFAELFVPDAVVDYTAVRAPHVCHGIGEILDYFQPANHPAAHHVTNIVVDESGDPAGRVTVHSKFFVPFTRDANVPKRFYGGDYFDVVVKTPAGWKFAEKRCVGRWQYTPDPGEDVPEFRRTF